MKMSAKVEIDEISKEVEFFYGKLGIPASDLVKI